MIRLAGRSSGSPSTRALNHALTLRRAASVSDSSALAILACTLIATLTVVIGTDVASPILVLGIG